MPAPPPIPVRIARAALAAIIALASTGAGAGPPADALSRCAVDFARQEAARLGPRVDVEAADPSRPARPCDGPLAAFLPAGVRLWGRSSIGVRCDVAGGWSTVVGVWVRVYAPVAVTRRALGAGDTVAAADVMDQERDLTRLPGTAVDATQAVGRVVRSPLPAGSVLLRTALREAFAVTSGQMVQLRAGGEDFTVSVEARALGNAGLGESVPVRTPSGRVVRGVVTAPGVVEAR